MKNEIKSEFHKGNGRWYLVNKIVNLKRIMFCALKDMENIKGFQVSYEEECVRPEEIESLKKTSKFVSSSFSYIVSIKKGLRNWNSNEERSWGLQFVVLRSWVEPTMTHTISQWERCKFTRNVEYCKWYHKEAWVTNDK